MLLLLLACAGVIVYAAFLLDPANRGDWLPYAMVIVAETSSSRTRCCPCGRSSQRARPARLRLPPRPGQALRPGRDHPRRRRDGALVAHVPAESPVTVDVFVTTYGEDLGTIRRTVSAALAMQRTPRHLGARRRPVRRGPRPLRSSWARGTCDGCPPTAPRPATSTTRCRSPRAILRRLRRRLRAAPAVPARDLPVLRTDDVAFVQTPQAYGNLDTVISRAPATCSPCSTSSSSPAGTASTRPSAWVPTSSSAAPPSTRSAASTPTRSPRTCGRRSCCTRGLADGLHPDRCWPSATPPRPSRRTASSSCAGRPAASRSCCTHNPLSPKRHLTMDQRIQYLVTATHYLTGIAPLLLLLVPPLQIYFDLTPMNLDDHRRDVAAVLRRLLRHADRSWRSTRWARSAGRCSCWPRCRSRSTSAP